MYSGITDLTRGKFSLLRGLKINKQKFEYIYLKITTYFTYRQSQVFKNKMKFDFSKIIILIKL